MPKSAAERKAALTQPFQFPVAWKVGERVFTDRTMAWLYACEVKEGVLPLCAASEMYESPITAHYWYVPRVTKPRLLNPGFFDGFHENSCGCASGH